MKRIKWGILISTTIATLAPIILGILFYDKLPDIIPVHFDINNKPNNYASKDFALFAIPSIMACLQIVACVMGDVNVNNKEYRPRFEIIAKLIMPAVSIAVYTMMLAFALGSELDIRRITMFMIGVIIAIIGNYLPKVSSEMYTRIHPRVLLENEKLWNMSKKMMGYTYFIMGLVFIGTIFLDTIYSVVAVVMLIVVSLVEMLYMIYLAIKEKGKE